MANSEEHIRGTDQRSSEFWGGVYEAWCRLLRRGKGFKRKRSAGDEEVVIHVITSSRIANAMMRRWTFVAVGVHYLCQCYAKVVAKKMTGHLRRATASALPSPCTPPWRSTEQSGRTGRRTWPSAARGRE